MVATVNWAKVSCCNCSSRTSSAPMSGSANWVTSAGDWGVCLGAWTDAPPLCELPLNESQTKRGRQLKIHDLYMDHSNTKSDVGAVQGCITKTEHAIVGIRNRFLNTMDQPLEGSWCCSYLKRKSFTVFLTSFYLHMWVAGVTSNFVIIKATKNPTEHKILKSVTLSCYMWGLMNTMDDTAES